MGGLKITGGSLSGRRLEWHEISGTHPMGERQRLAIFNMLGEIRGTNVLDLYAGSGALGVEALSRGARKCVFVERSRKCAMQITLNLARLELEGEVVAQAAEKAIRNFARTETMAERGFARTNDSKHKMVTSASEKFDLIFCDPPYDKIDDKVLKMIPGILAKDGMLVVSHPEEFEIELAEVKLIRERKYAGANISIFVNA